MFPSRRCELAEDVFAAEAEREEAPEDLRALTFGKAFGIETVVQDQTEIGLPDTLAYSTSGSRSAPFGQQTVPRVGSTRTSAKRAGSFHDVLHHAVNVTS